MLLIALHYGSENGVERWVIEVGLGGRCDATNVLPHALGVVTSVGLDHQAQLGSTLASIAHHKVGIGDQADTLMVCRPLDEPKELREFFEERWEAHWDAFVPPADSSTRRDQNHALARHVFERWEGRVAPEIALTEPLGRWESRRYRGVDLVFALANNPPALLDVAHRAAEDRTRVVFVLGCSRGRDPEALASILESAGEVIGVDGGFESAARWPGATGRNVEPDLASAVESALSLGPDRIVITGSAYLFEAYLNLESQ
jgi:folylpolyglutamate synthase/dihydropteroate synthase